ncbi:hypothetical protein WJX84_000414 [Apatococcus fuscideae]|uniref:Uncharacterized protein n=1 Tax=Apatococcus fuscideae TaxID=2026836 RepID=A0AAW1T3U4_9CHLO
MDPFEEEVRIVYRDTREPVHGPEGQTFSAACEPQTIDFSSYVLNERLQEVNAEVQRHQQAPEPTHIWQLAEQLLPGQDDTEAGPEQWAGGQMSPPASPPAPQTGTAKPTALPSTPPASAARPSLTALLGSHCTASLSADKHSNSAARQQPKTAARHAAGAPSSLPRPRGQKDGRGRRLPASSKLFSIRDDRQSISTPRNMTTPARPGPAQLQSPTTAAPGTARVSLSQSIQMLTGSPPAPSPARARCRASEDLMDDSVGWLGQDSPAGGNPMQAWPRRQLALPSDIQSAGDALEEHGCVTPAMHSRQPFAPQDQQSAAMQPAEPGSAPGAAAPSSTTGRGFLASAFKEGLKAGGILGPEGCPEYIHIMWHI